MLQLLEEMLKQLTTWLNRVVGKLKGVDLDSCSLKYMEESLDDIQVNISCITIHYNYFLMNLFLIHAFIFSKIHSWPFFNCRSKLELPIFCFLYNNSSCEDRPPSF